MRLDEPEKPEGAEEQQYDGSNPHEIGHSKLVIPVSRLDHSPKRQKSVGQTQYRSRRKRSSELEILRTPGHRRYPRADRVRLRYFGSHGRCWRRPMLTEPPPP